MFYVLCDGWMDMYLMGSPLCMYKYKPYYNRDLGRVFCNYSSFLPAFSSSHSAKSPVGGSTLSTKASSQASVAKQVGEMIASRRLPVSR